MEVMAGLSYSCRHGLVARLAVGIIYMNVEDSITGQIRSSKDIIFADKVIEQKINKSPWEVIETIVNHWISKNPTKYDSFLIDIKAKRDTRRNVYGSNKSRSIRSTLDIPADIIKMIRAVYKSDEFPMDKKFMEEMWRRYPVFRASERL